MVNYNLQKYQMENSRNNHCIKFQTVCHSEQFGSILHNPSLFAGKNHLFVQLFCAASYLPPSHSVALPVLRSAIMTSQSLCYISLILFNRGLKFKNSDAGNCNMLKRKFCKSPSFGQKCSSWWKKEMYTEIAKKKKKKTYGNYELSVKLYLEEKY